MRGWSCANVSGLEVERLLRAMMADTGERLIEFTRQIGRAEARLWQE